MIDATSSTVMAMVFELAERGVLPCLGIHAVRLGCNTAETTAGRQTIVALSNCLELEVYGTPAW